MSFGLAMRFLLAYLVFFAGGALLLKLARHRDRARRTRRTRGLVVKFLTFMVISLAILAVGWLLPGQRIGVGLAIALVMGFEVARLGSWEPFPFLGFLVALRLGQDHPWSTSAVAFPLLLVALRRDPNPTRRSLLFIATGYAAYVALIVVDPTGRAWCFLWISIATMDGYSQLIGQAYGSRSLAPSVSPNKTRVGAMGGAFTALVVGQCLAFAHPGLDRLEILGLSLGIATTAILGDLAASSIKRSFGVKDFSALLGPHGGVLDRLDSLWFSLPVHAHLLRVL